ncbi:MAG: hypothetical protein JRJ25_08915, partial [Deltaproteobacteria bacterium]|nr:hypothetical protein [Deltaproteobacteria bacterium]
MSMNIDNFKDLVLLVGTNPLPNFVVAEFFLKKNENIEKIWLIHSEKNENYFQAGTLECAKNLEKIITDRWKDKHKKLQFPLEKNPLSDVSNASKITANIKNMITELKENKSFHFNYTGGTKSMSTHSYWNLERIGEDVKKSFSYLDGRNFRLILDYPDEVIADDLRQEVNITFKELIELHGFERRNEDGTNLFANTLEIFTNLIESDRLGEFYEDNGGYNRKLFENDKGELAEKGQLKSNKKKKEKIDELKPNKIFQDIIDSMPEEYRIFDNNGAFKWGLAKNNFKKTLKYIDGEWLEGYIAKILEDEFCNNTGITFNNDWEIKKPDWPGDAYFQLDVIMVHGYQLTGISCTTAKKKSLCKSKGFEIIHRTKQIGGDEAKAVLIAFMDAKTRDAVQRELLYDTGVTQGNICVLGINDLKKDKLIKKIKKFIFDK